MFLHIAVVHGRTFTELDFRPGCGSISFISPGSAYTTQFNPYAYGSAGAAPVAAATTIPQTALIVPPSPAPAAQGQAIAAAPQPASMPATSMNPATANGTSAPTTYDHSVISAPAEPPPPDDSASRIYGMDRSTAGLAAATGSTLALIAATLMYGAFRRRGWARSHEDFGDTFIDIRPTQEEIDAEYNEKYPAKPMTASLGATQSGKKTDQQRGKRDTGNGSKASGASTPERINQRATFDRTRSGSSDGSGSGSVGPTETAPRLQTQQPLSNANASGASAMPGTAPVGEGGQHRPPAHEPPTHLGR